MHVENNSTEVAIESIHSVETPEPTSSEWTTPDFTEQSACAEICAYVFSV